MTMHDNTMKAVILKAYHGNIVRALRGLELVEMPMPEIRPDELLIRISAAPANPSDLAFIQGGYNIVKPLPAVPGFEGTGRVIQTGNAPEAKAMHGKRVSFFSQSDHGGSWATHIAVKAADCLELDERMPVEQAACFSVNPFTAHAMVALAIDSGSRAIIQNAAAGQVGRFINVLASKAGITVINIVRKEAHIEKLRSLGSEHIMWTQEEGFTLKLRELAAALHADVAFDAVGGEHTGQLLAAMPEGSTLYLYGALGGRKLSEIPASDLIFMGKSIRGFNMNEWKAKLQQEAFRKISLQLQQMFLDGVLKTEISNRFALGDHEKALLHYIRAMSEGKVLLLPD
jgi:NADPH:quinone reductase-like Zn-dependent oxidoreductase